MSTLELKSNSTFITEVSVNESDKYSNAVYLTMKRRHPYGVVTSGEHFMSPAELAELGQFYIQRSIEITAEQQARDLVDK